MKFYKTRKIIEEIEIDMTEEEFLKEFYPDDYEKLDSWDSDDCEDFFESREEYAEYLVTKEDKMINELDFDKRFKPLVKKTKKIEPWDVDGQHWILTNYDEAENVLQYYQG